MPLAVSPSYPRDGRIFAGPGSRVLACDVGAGQRRPVWHTAQLGGGAVAVTAVAASPNYAEDGTVFAATNAGVFVSRDRGDTFQSWSDGLVPPGMVALAISQSYRDDRLVYGLGLGGTVWRRQDETPVSRG